MADGCRDIHLFKRVLRLRCGNSQSCVDLARFDDVWPVFENPTAAVALLGEGVAEDFGGVAEGELAAGERLDDVALVGRRCGDRFI